MRDFTPKYSRGRDTEEGVLGRLRKDYEREFPGETYEKHETYPMETLYEITKDFQPDNTGKPFPKYLCDQVSYNLGLDETRQVKIYTSVGYHLDWRGVDTFIEVNIGNGEIIRCPIDLKTDPNQITPEEGVRIEPFNKGRKQDRVIFYYPSDGISYKRESQKFFVVVDKVAKAIEKVLRRQSVIMGVTIRPITEYELDESNKIIEVRHNELIRRWKKRTT